jgi:glycosyltransferase involved in cell wall biosynthesis
MIASSHFPQREENHMSKHQIDQPSDQELIASIIITTYNRCDALVKTLNALSRQTVPPRDYEIIVVDNGSNDQTSEVVAGLTLSCKLKLLRHEKNQGISGGRNLALRQASGKYLILVSDDLIVPENFIALHLETLKRFAGYWVVGGFEQLESLTETPFGRYLDQLEQGFTERRKSTMLAPGIWEMGFPTARNLSLPRQDYERIGPFDEQFANACEDQDWAHRAQVFGIRFLYNDAITCLHNDQAGDLERYCRAQMRGAHDTVLFCAKYPELHGGAAIARVNGHLSSADDLNLAGKKIIKRVINTRLILVFFEKLIATAETAHLRESLLWKMYRMLIGIYIFRGWRAGLAKLEREAAESHARSLGYHSNL